MDEQSELKVCDAQLNSLEETPIERNGEYKWMGHVNFDTYGKEIKREWKKIQPEIFSFLQPENL